MVPRCCCEAQACCGEGLSLRAEACCGACCEAEALL